MKKGIKKVARTIALILALCATSGAWALNSLEETGGFVMPAAQLAFKDVALSEIVSGSVRCRMLGSSINDDGKEAVTCFYDTSHLEDASPYVTCEAQMYDDPNNHYVKGVILEFTQVGSDIYVKSKGTCYKQYSGATTPGGESIATSNYSAGATGYSINHIRFMNRDTLPSRSINVNFYENVKRVSTTDDVGLLESAVPGNLWDNVFIENTTTPASVQVLGTDKVRSSSDGLAVSISGTRGAYWPSNADSSYTYDVRAGYIDDDYNNSTPSVTVVNIPFKYYRVYVYHSNDTVGRKFGYDTINGVNYYYNRGGTGTFNHGVYLSIGTGSWGGASITDQYEGANCLVSPVISGSTLTIVGHSDINSDGTSATYRAGFAAIQVVEVKSPVKPLAIWNGDFNVNYTRGPISFSYNGHTVADDGSKVTVVSGTQNKGGVRFVSDTGYSKLGAVAALGNVQKSASGVCGLMGIRSSNNDYRTWLGLQSNKYDLGSWKNGGSSDTSNSAWAYPSDNARHYFGIATEHIGADSNGSGTFGYLDGNSTPILRNAFSDKDDRDLSRLNGIAAGGYWGNGQNEWICPNSTLHYIAVFNSSDAETVNYWSLTGMTSAENVALTDGEGSLSGGSGVGVNLNGGRVTVSGATVAAALFVQADTTLVFEDGDASLEISGPLYIADGKTLTIEVLEDANCVAGTAYTKDLITAEDYFTENSTITVTQLPDVDAGSETASVEGPISWSYEPDVVPVWNNGAWDVNPTASTKVIKINSSSGATYNAGGDYTTVYVIGTGTQPIGEYGLTAGTLVIESGASINMANVTATTVVGEGTAIYTLGTSGGYVTSEEKPFTDSRWTGTVELKDCYINAIVLQHYGNSGSTVRANNLNGYLKANTEDIAEVKAVEIGTGGFTLNNGLHSQRWVFSAAITGTGDFKVATSSNASSGTISQFVFIGDMDGFGGNLNFGTLTSAEPEIIIAPDKASIPAKANYDSSATRAKISILSGASATIASGKTWSTSSRGSDYPNWQVDGTLRIKGSIYGGAGGAGSQWCRCQGTGTVIFDGKFPGGSEYGEAWWNGTNWAGTLEITNATTTTAIYLQQLGSSQSTVRFSGFTGPMKSGGNSIKAVEIGPAGWTLNGTFAPTIPADLKGPGVLTVSTTGDSAKTITFSGDVSAFAGKVAFSGDENSRVLLGAASTGRAMSKSVIIGEGATCVMGQAWDSVYYDIYVDGQLTVGKRLGTFNAVGIGQSGALEVVSGGFVWASNGLTVDGTMTAPKYDTETYFGGGTTITVNSTGVFELGANAGNVDVNGVSHAKITGTGTIKFPSDSTGYYTIPSSADKMFATTLSVINDNAKALIVTFNNNTSAVTTNRNMHGSGSYRSDWGTGTSRGLLALQDKNTEWSGTFWTTDAHRIKEFIVAGVDGASQKTLKLSGAQVANGSTPLTVESSGSANLTGTWYGNATVDGTFGGTGTLSGNLTFNAGSTFKAYASDADGLSVSGTVTLPETGITVDVSDLALPASGTTLMTFTSAPSESDVASKMTPSSGAFLELDGSALKAYPIVAIYGGENYSTFADAIDAALADEGGVENLAKITVVNATAELPAGYLIVDNHVVKAQGAIVDTNGTAHYYATAQAAVDAVDSYIVSTVYDYFAVYYGTDVDISINPSKQAWTYGGVVKVKCLNGSTVVVTLDSDEYTLDPSEPEDGLVTYSKIAVATTYVWVGATSDGDAVNAKQWDRPSNWRVGTSDGATASRSPSPIDTANLVGGAYVTGISVAGSLTITGSGTLTSTGAISLTTSGATISVTGVTLSSRPTTTVARSRVVDATEEGTTTYSVELIPGTIFSVY